jgi:hypothetical protein
VKFDLYNNAGEGNDSVGVFTGGASPTAGGDAPLAAGSNDLTGSSIDLHSGHRFDAAVSYDGATLTLTDATTRATVTRSYAVNLTSVLGGDTAFAGFTAGTGSVTSTDDVLSWTFTPGA